MSDYPNGSYHLHFHDWPDAIEVCQVFNGFVSFAGDDRLYALEKILRRGKLIRLEEVVEQRKEGSE